MSRTTYSFSAVIDSTPGAKRYAYASRTFARVDDAQDAARAYHRESGLPVEIVASRQTAVRGVATGTAHQIIETIG